LAERYRTRGLRVVSTAPINDEANDAEKTAVAQVAQDEHMTYPCFLDVRSGWAHQTGLSVRPAFMVIGRDGRVAFRVAAVLTDDPPELHQLEDAIVHALDAH
jgi:hypothetical protein